LNEGDNVFSMNTSPIGFLVGDRWFLLVKVNCKAGIVVAVDFKVAFWIFK